MPPQKPSTIPVVLVDDEQSVLLSTRMILLSGGIRNVQTFDDSRDLMPYLESHEVSVVVLDLFMPYIPGNKLLPEIVRAFPDLPVVMMTASQEIESAVQCMKEGAFDYLVKPVEENRLISCIKRAMELRALRQQVDTLKRYLITDHLEHGEAFSRIVTVSRKMRTLFQYAEAVSESGEPVLISGETGTGKELFAAAVHELSNRAGPLVTLNVAGLDDALFSDTLFGHKKGAFSGAESSREGLVAQASGGTLFLDEIGDLKAASQVKLLRLLQEQEYHPLGSDVAKIADVRVICATNRDLRERMDRGKFRPDLYFRLSVHQIDIPPLRERREDIPVLLAHFAMEAGEAMQRKVPNLPTELLTLLENYYFPGNVRELRAMLFDVMAQHPTGRVLSVKSFRKLIKIQQKPVQNQTKESAPVQEGQFPTLKEAEEMHIREAMRRAGGNQGTAATLLGISRPALNRRLANRK